MWGYTYRANVSYCRRAVRWARPSPAAGVQAESARSEGGHLQKTAGHRDVLEEMDELVLVGEVVMECERGGDRERGKQCGRDASLVTGDQGQTATDLDRNGDRISKRGERQAHRGNVADGVAWRRELGETGKKEDRCNQDTPDHR